MRIGFVHTAHLMIEQFRSEMGSRFPEVDCFHILNEGPLQSLRRGMPRSEVYRRVVAQLLLAVDEGADLVVQTSSSLSPAVDLARPLTTVPVLKMDDPMAAEAVRLGRRIVVICNNTSAPGPSASLLRQHGAAQGMEVIVETIVRPEAFTALFAGDRARHDDILIEAAREALPRADVYVLPQGSLADLEPGLEVLGKPVLSSPRLMLRELARRLAPESAGL